MMRIYSLNRVYLNEMKRKHITKWIWRLGVLCLLFASCQAINPVMIHFENDTRSISHGESWDGSMEYGKRLPSSGDNFSGVSHTLMALGRNGVHSELRKTVLATYDTINKALPNNQYLYGECGWTKGGKFWPHYTHQNGLVIDFMVPVIRTKDSSITTLPTHIFNRFAYAREFDSSALSGKYAIDFESMAAHLYFLQVEGKKHGISIRRIIFAPEFLPKLYATSYGPMIKDINFVYKKNWLRHDDHYHVEFLYEPVGQ